MMAMELKRFYYSLFLVLCVAEISRGDQALEDVSDETNNDCFFKWGGACVHRSSGKCPFSGGRISWEGCPSKYVCCVPPNESQEIFAEDSIKNLHCGQSSIEDGKNRILGGWRAKQLEWPWVVSLKSGTTPVCGGTIIAPRWVVTAAHCLKDEYGDLTDWTVTVGEYDLLRREKGNQFMKVEKIVIHPQYSVKERRNDIALLRLTSDIVYTEAAQPVCLPDQKTKFVGKTCVVVGWGHMNDYETISQFLQVLNVPIVPDSQCVAAYKDKYHDHNMCAGYNEDGRDSCQGDSGGPLMCRFTVKDQKHWELAGIVSWGTHCGNRKYRGVYVKVTHFLPWIYETIEANQ